MATPDVPQGFEQLLAFPLVEALFGRRSRRFALGAAIPTGPLAFTSRHAPQPLTEVEKMLVLTATAGNTGWHHLIKHREGSAGLPGYASSAGGRTFPAAAGLHSSDLFFTDDEGVYFFATRDAPGLVERDGDGALALEQLLEDHRARIRKVADGRLHLPPDPFIAKHNRWCANVPGSLFIIPVADVSLELLGILCYLVENGACIYDDVNRQPIPGLERFRHLIDVENPGPLSELERNVLTYCTVEVSSACYAGMLILQGMGLGGWMYTGMDGLAILGASGDPTVPGLGFRYDTDERWVMPNPTGLPGVFESYCPPYYPDMRAAVAAFLQRKFGEGGPYHASTPGPWKESATVRGSAQLYSEEFSACVTLMVQYIYDRFGKFPGTVPSIFAGLYLQAHHLDLEFYDGHFTSSAYLWTHAQHAQDWHPE